MRDSRRSNLRPSLCRTPADLRRKSFALYRKNTKIITLGRIRTLRKKSDESSKSYEKVPSGIPGFDDLVNGGFHRRTVNTVTGASGTGKTVFASQFIREGIKNGERG